MSKSRNIADLGSNDVLETTSTGVDVTGTVTADGLTSDDALLIQSAAGTFTKIENNGKKIAYFQDDCDVAFYEDTGTTAQFFWDASAQSLGINTASPAKTLHVSNGSSGISSFASNTDVIIEDNGNAALQFATPNTQVQQLLFSDPESNTAGVIQYSHADDAMSFSVNDTEAMRIDSLGDFQHGMTNGNRSFNVAGNSQFNSTLRVVDKDVDVTVGDNLDAGLGVEMTTGGGIIAHRHGSYPIHINRSGSDGTIQLFRAQGTVEGSISVSGSTISFNGGHLSRWSRLPEGTDDTNILKGTVMTNLNAMCEWRDEAGDLEDNEQLNHVTVSSVEGDKNVAGVFVSWDEDDDWGDFYLAQTGDMVIRIASGTTVQQGDLLMSAGDGTAKPQEDDIVRSKTVAKVTSTHVSNTYDDGSYCVPCVLMAC